MYIAMQYVVFRTMCNKWFQEEERTIFIINSSVIVGLGVGEMQSSDQA